MVRQVFQGPLAGDDGLHEEAEHGEHGQPSVLELLHLELREGLGVVGQSQRVEAAAGVKRIDDLAQRPSGDAVALDSAHKDHLRGPDGEDALRVHQAGVTQVVQAPLAEDLRAGLEPHGLAELDAVASQQLREDAAQRAEHGPPGVDHLQLPVLGEGLRVGGEPGSVPAVVAGELAGQVGGGLPGEGSQVLDAVGPVPGASRGRGLGLSGGLTHGDPALPEDLGSGGGELHRLPGEGGGGESHGRRHCGNGHLRDSECLVLRDEDMEYDHRDSGFIPAGCSGERKGRCDDYPSISLARKPLAPTRPA